MSFLATTYEVFKAKTAEGDPLAKALSLVAVGALTAVGAVATKKVLDIVGGTDE